MYQLYRTIRRVFESILNRLLFKRFGVEVLGDTKGFEGILTIRSSKRNSITIGKNVQIRSGKAYNIIGGDTRLILRTIDDGQIRIGNGVGISNSAVVSANSITIEDDVFIGGSCAIYDTDFHSSEYDQRINQGDKNIKSAPVIIKKGAFIGSRCIILKGVTVGEEAIIGAGSVVTKDIPDGEIWAGNPAKYIKKVNKVDR